MIARLSDAFGDFAGRSWLNTAHQGALPLPAAEAAHEAIRWKTAPHELTTERFEEVPRRLRTALGRLVGAPPGQIVLANSASYGLHLIANAYPWAPGDEVLVMAGDFPSDIFPWLTLERRGVTTRRVRPADRMVTADELAAAVTPRTRLFCVTWVHSFSGKVADLDALGAVCRERGVHFVVNGSQAVGARPLDVSRAPVDALVSVGFKWLCGPYGTGFAWLSPALRAVLVPPKAYWLAYLSQRDLARDDLEPELTPGDRHDLDIFGTANFHNYVPWTRSVEHVLDLGVDRIRAHDAALVERLTEGLRAKGMRVSPTDSTLLYFSHPDPGRNKALHERLAAEGIDVALRAGSLRASPHLYNSTVDVDRLLDAVSRAD
ncbi:aminotransferase [Virgisporangium aliadipatigenens]|uniref:Aminotransferase n=1 Tax=Virgisporangium aliadipatigenens TaxID=741659 RepID=A0A8J3YG16_9ACTN|nr:aminotransferase class V-fold PLP-dependent enzyme [Virgisporangium aliadipatigenens]GIJ44356.1 aminotransferase [Virgisporangium aliadipatigenens]